MKKGLFYFSIIILSSILFYSCSNRISAGSLSIVLPSAADIVSRAPETADGELSGGDNISAEDFGYYYEVVITNKTTNYTQKKTGSDANNQTVTFLNLAMGTYKIEAAVYVLGIKYLSGSAECTVNPDVITNVTISLSHYETVNVEFSELEDAIKKCTGDTKFVVTQEKDSTEVITDSLGTVINELNTNDATDTSVNIIKNIILDLSACTKIKEIGQEAFSGCEGLEKIILPSGITNIGYHAFYSMYGKIQGDFSKVESLGEGAFASVGELSGNLSFTSEELDNIPASCFTLTSIESITLGKNVAEIGASAFLNCSSLKEVKLLSEEVVALGNFSFSNITPVLKLYVKQGLKQKYLDFISNSSNVSELTVNNVEIIEFE